MEVLADVGQRRLSRLSLQRIPVDLSVDATGFHSDARLHVARHQPAGRGLPSLGCNDRAVSRASFDGREDRATWKSCSGPIASTSAI